MDDGVEQVAEERVVAVPQEGRAAAVAMLRDEDVLALGMVQLDDLFNGDAPNSLGLAESAAARLLAAAERSEQAAASFPADQDYYVDEARGLRDAAAREAAAAGGLKPYLLRAVLANDGANLLAWQRGHVLWIVSEGFDCYAEIKAPVVVFSQAEPVETYALVAVPQ